MVVVDFIDLTTPSPPPITHENDSKQSVEVVVNDVEKKRKRRRKKADRKENLEEIHYWELDESSGGDKHDSGAVRKRHETDDPSWRRRKRERSVTPPLFTVDTVPSAIVGSPISIQPSPRTSDQPPLHTPDISSTTLPAGPSPSLILPAHVILSVQDSAGVSGKNPPLSPVSEASGIDFLDDDRAVGAPRYFDDPVATAKTVRSCKRCGDTDHDVKNCRNTICLTCGARNEHNPRSCPILRFCWNCKGKGHISRDCPRLGDMDQRRLDRPDCERCGSWRHHGTNCPTLWRIYTYLTDAERGAILSERESKSQLGFGGGGEGYIARDQWCYNCGESGHLGDDCKVAAHNHDKPDDDSAFGSYNLFTGPFASQSYVVPEIQRMPRGWEQGEIFDDGYGFSVEDNVGRKGRENAKAKAREAQRRFEEDSDEPDWFSRNRNALNGKEKAAVSSNPRGKHNPPPKRPVPTMRLGSLQSSSKPPWNLSRDQSTGSPLPPRPSLLDRIDLDDKSSPREPRRDLGGKTLQRTQRNYRDKRRGDLRREKGDTPGEGRRKKEEKRRRDQEAPQLGHKPTYREHKDERGGRWRGGYDR